MIFAVVPIALVGLAAAIVVSVHVFIAVMPADTSDNVAGISALAMGVFWAAVTVASLYCAVRKLDRRSR